MNLKLVCVIFILLITTTRSLCAFKTQMETEKKLVSLDQKMAKSGLQMLLQRSKRFDTHFPICIYCCNCCQNKGCGRCCWS